MPTDRNDRLRLAMVGGGTGSLIGATHRMAATLDGNFELVAGALSATRERSLTSAADVGLDPARSYGTWEELIAGEAARPASQRAQVVAVVTPNNLHFPVAQAALEAGFHVVVDKPMATSVDEAEALERAVVAGGLVFAVTYNYTGYPMVKEARDLIRRGEIGELRRVVVEYHQGWLARKIEDAGQKQAEWRMDPSRAGIAGTLADIGSHAENLVSMVTGLELEAICADVAAVVPGRVLDDDSSMLLRFSGGARGVLMASQISPGEENNLRIRVYGSEGGLEWAQQDPDTLRVATIDGPARILRRGAPYLSLASLRATRLPPGLPEAFIEAFANIYAEVARAVRDHIATGSHDVREYDFPTVVDGARGNRFIACALRSSMSDVKWTGVR